MENQNSMELRQGPRDIETVTGEIRTLMHQAQVMALGYAIEIGRRLYEAKSLLKHGEWGKWLAENVEFSQSKANDMMKIFDEYGSQQITLFGAVANSQTLGNLPYTKALKLLALPADEREEFVESHDVESISTRELDKLIREKKEAEAAAEQAEQKAEEIGRELEDLRASLDAKQAAVNEAADREQALRDELLAAQKARAAADEALKQAQANTEVPDSVMKKLKAEAKKKAVEDQKAAAEKLAAETEKKLSAAESQRKAAEAEALEARSKLEQMEKKLKTASPEAAQFSVYFEQLQEVLQKCDKMINGVRGHDEAMAEKFTAALKAVCGRYAG